MRSSSGQVNAKSSARVLRPLVALFNGARFEAGIVRRLLLWWPVWAVLVAAMALAVAAYQRPGTYVVDVGSRSDQAYTRNFHTRLEEPGRTYRWSDVYGYVSFPGVGGSRPFTVTATLDAQRQAAIEIHINGERFYEGVVEPGWRTFNFRVDEAHPVALSSRDTLVELRAPEYRLRGEEGESKGLKVDSVTVEQAPVGGFIWPSVATLAYLGGAMLLTYLLFGRALYQVSGWKAIRVRALVIAGLTGLGLCVALLLDRAWSSAAMPHVAVTLGTMLALLIIGERSVSRIAPTSGGFVPRVLGLCLAAAFGLRYGGMALPQSVIIDMPYHMKWLRTLLAGDWPALYFPGGLSTVPPEWGMSLLIPKSPLFYFAFAPLNLLPFELETLTKWLICLLDATLVLFAYGFTRRVGASKGAALGAALLYATMPLAFRALSYGILPTIFAQCLAVLLFAMLLVLMDKGWRAGSFVLAVLISALTLLAFPTVALFVTLVLFIVPVFWWLNRPPGGERGVLSWQPYGMLAGAWGLALVAYYGLYIDPVVASAQALLAPSADGGTSVKWPGGVSQLIAWTADYLASLLPVLLAAMGVLLLFVRKHVPQSARRTLLLLAVWLATGPVFVAANYKVDMIGKHLFFIMLPVAVAGGVALRSVWLRSVWGVRLGVLLVSTVAWQSLVFWVERLVRAST